MVRRLRRFKHYNQSDNKYKVDPIKELQSKRANFITEI